MHPITVGIVVFACTIASLSFGSLLRELLPPHHLSEESRNALKLGTGLIATLTALVLGLLVSSAKSSFDALSAGLVETGAKIITLDRLLAHYGPETTETRLHLRNAVASTIARVWPEETGGAPRVDKGTPLAELSTVVDRIELLPVDNVQQRAFQSQTLSMSTALTLSCWQLVERVKTSLPTHLLTILTFWLCILFAQVGLFAPRNWTVGVVAVLCALSTSAALFLILEMNMPLGGLIKVSSAPLRAALEQLGK